MAKLTIMGDSVQIKSDITKSEMDRVMAFAPEALKLYDEDGNEIFGVTYGDAFFSKYGICFCNEDADGKLFMTTNNPVRDHSDAEEERKEVIKYFAPILNKLQLVEAHIASAKDALEAMEASVTDSVTFA